MVWERCHEDKLFDSTLLRFVGNMHFWNDKLWMPKYTIVRTQQHVYLRTDKRHRYEIDAYAIYKLDGGSVRRVGFELKLDNNFESFNKAVEQAVLRRGFFDYFYIVLGGVYIYPYAIDFVRAYDVLKERGIGLILRATKWVQGELTGVGDPIVLVRSEYRKPSWGLLKWIEGGNEGGETE